MKKEGEETSSRYRPSFFKVIIKQDFNRILRLPPAFMQKYPSMPSENVKLRIESGRTWDVTIKYTKGGVLCFKKGWRKFAQDVGLKLGEFIVFYLNGGGWRHIDVHIYETSGCQKQVPTTKSTINPLYYQFVLKKHHKSRMTPMRSFARAAGLMKKECVEVIGEHHKQMIQLDNSLKDRLRIDMTGGWARFRIANRLEYGKRYSIEFKPEENVIQVKEC